MLLLPLAALLWGGAGPTLTDADRIAIFEAAGVKQKGTGWRRCEDDPPAASSMTFKVTDEEARLIRARAKKERVTVSEYLRRRASLALTPVRKPVKVRCPHTGAMIFAAPDHQPPLTTDAVRQLVADFP